MNDEVREIKNKVIELTQDIIDKSKEDADQKVEAAKGFINKFNEKRKEGVQALGEVIDRVRYEYDVKNLKPINNIEEINSFPPKILSIFEKDDKRKNSDACKNAIGHLNEHKSIRMCNIYPENIKILREKNINLVNGAINTIYFINPYIENQYIPIDNYFTYIQKNVVEEIDRVAHSLGAKHLKIVLKKEQKTYMKKSKSLKVKANNIDGNNAKIALKENESNKEYSEISIEKEVSYKDNIEVKIPELVYLCDEIDIRNLINQASKKQILSKTFSIKMANCMHIDKNFAVDFDAALETWKLAGSATISSEIESQNRNILEYTIDF